MKSFQLKIVVAAALLVAGCSDRDPAAPLGPTGSVPPTHDDVWTSGPPAWSIQPNMDLSGVVPCGPAHDAELRYEGEPIGTVRMMNDETALYVTYRTSDEWFISNTLLSLSPTTYGIYTDATGRASPWAFSRQEEQWPVVQEHTTVIPYSEYSVSAGEDLTIVAVAGLVHRQSLVEPSQSPEPVGGRPRAGARRQQGVDRGSRIPRQQHLHRPVPQLG
ncbi:MAG: hypothetical protein WD737_14150 [Gemmatimonadota bacterium]